MVALIAFKNVSRTREKKLSKHVQYDWTKRIFSVFIFVSLFTFSDDFFEVFVETISTCFDKMIFLV